MLIDPRDCSDSEHLKAHSFTHWAVWLGVVASCVTISFILAEAIPFFGALTSRLSSYCVGRSDNDSLSLGLIGATLGTFMVSFSSILRKRFSRDIGLTWRSCPCPGITVFRI